jgi:hypothetical protein
MAVKATGKRGQARPGLSSEAQLRGMLAEFDIRPPGRVSFSLVSRWAAKHVWRVDADGEAWAYIRMLVGPGEEFPDRWRHMRLSGLLHEARIGPRVLGISAQSNALGGRAAIVEAALAPVPRAELEMRAAEGIALFARLHGNTALREALEKELTESERKRLQPLNRLFRETRERWFEAVVERWLEAGIAEINELTEVVAELINRLERIDCCADSPQIVVPAHNDPNAGNFKTNRRGSLRLIDFEDMGLNHPVADLGMFLAWFAAPEDYRSLLSHYALVEPDAILEEMAVWVPLRYINVGAHWAARLLRARDLDTWEFAVESIDEWLGGAADIVFDRRTPLWLTSALHDVRTSLIERRPFG